MLVTQCQPYMWDRRNLRAVASGSDRLVLIFPSLHVFVRRLPCRLWTPSKCPLTSRSASSTLMSRTGVEMFAMSISHMQA